MAIKNLEQELEQVFAQIFKPGQLNPKSKKTGSKSSGSEDPVRALLDLFSFKFRIVPSEIEQQILDYKVSTGKSVDKVKVFKSLLQEGDRVLVQEVAKEIVRQFKTIKPAKSKNYTYSVKNFGAGGIELNFDTEETVSEQSIYNAANSLKTKVSKQVFSTGKGKQLFDKMAKNALSAKEGNQGEKLTMGGIFNVGHDYPVAKVSAAFLQDGVDSVQGSELVSEETNAIKKMVSSKLGEFNLDFSMAREAAVWSGGKLIPNANHKFYIESNLETKFKNQVQAQQAGGEGATKVGDATGELLREIRKYLKDAYNDAKGHVEKQASEPFIDQIAAGFVFHKSINELYRRKLAKNITKYRKAPTDTKFARTKNKSKKYKGKRVVGTLGLGAPKGIKSRPVQEKGAGQGDLKQQRATEEAFKTRAFVNAKLAKQVTGNMGRPGLINQSGRFAESAVITNAASTGNMAHFDYTYNPLYKVFEGGREFTPNYDPRPIIEKSIRQLAAARLETKFTLRRV